jgi:hypothetical protein
MSTREELEVLSPEDVSMLLWSLRRATCPELEEVIRQRADHRPDSVDVLKNEIRDRLDRHWANHGMDGCDCLKDLIRDGLIPMPERYRIPRTGKEG